MWVQDFESGTASGGTGVLAPSRTRARPRRRRDAGGPPPPVPPDSWGGDGDGDGGDDGPTPGGERPPRGTPPEAARFALTLAMIGIGTLFAVFLATWVLLRRGEPDPLRASPLVPPATLWLGTALLAASSLALERCARVRSTARGTRPGSGWLRASLALGLAFVLTQVWLWRTLIEGGVIPSTGAYGAILFALTGLHAVHVLGGLAAMTAVLRRLRRGRLDGAAFRLCATYWHFMGALWLVIFAVLILV